MHYLCFDYMEASLRKQSEKMPYFRTFSALVFSLTLFTTGVPAAMAESPCQSSDFTAEVSTLPLSAMTSEEVIDLLASMPALAGPGAMREMPLLLTADDMLTKVYGVIDSGLDKEGVIKASETILDMSPTDDRACLWLDPSDGYGICYSGMQPDVSAMARFDRDSISDFGFFFLFPYQKADKHKTIEKQVLFCGSLLQEMHDMGAELGNDDSTDGLFDVSGDYNGNFVAVRLIDDPGADPQDPEGRYIMILSVEPRGFTESDRSEVR